ncbi:pyruvate kinase [Novosphingobium mangrovi (ex Huang et al. 2023)]|uniref:Pyruvate kinase n=1 Tax=Novosphingobium mangrovi (ex Huang et al. 2023) TaxID=2976432 RepID=A0ABT2I371_9SPHN|nr:pyruvate kinase [Novosphingobium mangrovi (ex Huang et al. 2023)]MCT2399255.1 pyruvate kinase [Novosphingobium mangrovi (ex Huang et al. 2023)]
MVHPSNRRSPHHRGIKRARKVKILATLGPASRDRETIAKLLKSGADAFRVNMSHGDHETHRETIANIRAVEKDLMRPVAILCDLQGPKLRVGTFKDGKAFIRHGAHFTLDSDPTPGDENRVCLPHSELFGILEKGQRLLIDDGKLRFVVIRPEKDKILCTAEVGGTISDRKGVNVPDAIIPVPALTEKDRRDLSFAISEGADWIGLSFVQRPEDVAEARRLMGGYGALMAKIEKPAAVQSLDEIIELSDGIMVARGDLGVELLPEEVPPIQKHIIEKTRACGKPVVVATQMLESMITSPTPTRAEVSDVANAVYDGADAVMLSAETAAGQWPVEAVTIMDRIATQVESDSTYHERIHIAETPPDATTADALSASCATIADTLPIEGIIIFTGSGSSARRVARERPAAPMLVLTPSIKTARRGALLWGAHTVLTKDIGSFEEMIAKGKRMALRHGFGAAGSRLVTLAGVPFGVPGSTNLLHVVTLSGNELKTPK